MRRSIVALVVALGLAGSLAAPAQAQENPVPGLLAWGWNVDGQLGDTTTTDRALPTVVQDPAGVLTRKRITAVSAGYSFGCVLADGAPYCWGRKGDGQLGTGTLTPTDELTPVATDVSGVLQGKRVTSIATSYHNTCVIASDQLYCWGSNNNGQLANGATSSPVPTPAKVSGFEGKKVTAVTMGRFHVCAIADGLVYCWGSNDAGQAGTGSLVPTTVTTPVQVDYSGALKGLAVTQIDAGDYYTCALADARAFCWGSNLYGQAGDGSADDWVSSPRPVLTSGALKDRKVTTLSAGNFHACVLADGSPVCWGNNNGGPLGTGSLSPAFSRVPVAALPGAMAGHSISELVSGYYSTCAVADGKPYCWGYSQFGELGKGTFKKYSPAPAPVLGTVPDLPTRQLSGGGLSYLYLSATVPTAPRSVEVIAGTDSATLFWQRPTDNGGRQVTSYAVSGGGTCTTSSTSCTITGLQPGRNYAFTVVARNEIGDSAGSTVTATTQAAVTTPPVPQTSPKSQQRFPTKAKIKKRGVTVLVAAPARTSAGVLVRSRVTGTAKKGTKRFFSVHRSGDALKVRTYGRTGWRLVLTQRAAGTDTALPLLQKIVYVNGRRQ